jgi:hypothetical protein
MDRNYDYPPHIADNLDHRFGRETPNDGVTIKM